MEPDTTASLCVLPVRPLLCDALAKDVAAAPAWQDWHWLPVVNRENRPVWLLNQRRLVADKHRPLPGSGKCRCPANWRIPCCVSAWICPGSCSTGRRGERSDPRRQRHEPLL